MTTGTTGPSSRVAALAVIAVMLGASGCRSYQRTDAPPPHSLQAWATKLDDDRLDNFFRVDEGLYRAAQPAPEAFSELNDHGIRTVVNLRNDRADEAPAALGLQYVEIPMIAWDFSHADVMEFLVVATDPRRRPVLVHCQHGADRTGVVCGAYRMVVQGWSSQEAIAEMTRGGYGYFGGLEDPIRYLRSLDVEAARAFVERNGRNRLPAALSAPRRMRGSE